VISLSAHISLLFGEYPYAERPFRAAAAGFGAIETWWPTRGEAAALVTAVDATGLRVSALNADGGDLAQGERGFLNDPLRADEAVAAIDDALSLATLLACPHVHVLLGRRMDGSLRTQEQAVVEALRAAAPAAQAAGITLLLEPLNAIDTPGYLASTPAAVAALLERVGSMSVRMMFDAYHVARSGLDPIATLADVCDYVAHVQFADCPGRGAPGSGRLDLWRLCEALDAAGYGGAIGLEYEPGPSTLDGLSWLTSPPRCVAFPAHPTR